MNRDRNTDEHIRGRRKFMKYRQGLKALMIVFVLTGLAGVCAAAGLTAVPGQPQADDFSLPAADGSRHALADYRGDYVLVNFWAGWCSPCIKELPSMQRVYTAMKGRDFEILAIHVGPETADTQDMLERFAISFPVLVDAELALDNWDVNGLPTSFLLDPEGRVIYRATGPIDWDEPAQRELLEQLLDGRSRAANNSSVSATTL
jgi:peroxiredoxin